jgi:hypothetical protein
MGINKARNYGFARNVYLLVGGWNFTSDSNPSDFVILNN